MLPKDKREIVTQAGGPLYHTDYKTDSGHCRVMVYHAMDGLLYVDVITEGSVRATLKELKDAS